MGVSARFVTNHVACAMLLPARHPSRAGCALCLLGLTHAWLTTLLLVLWGMCFFVHGTYSWSVLWHVCMFFLLQRPIACKREEGEHLHRANWL